eukprot:NODE_452_length_1485_cov_58.861561_g420_i0.p2 GENE.NODE_452_length_1485_cov_58.861561_g420_i0~~NODE_452_length_1485_cov_58.861561_g420_i0.p2  ORF type:complete len:191 (+),score=20.23 NODE_452_length_1485_cov_58.861561_g420_i0:319-891(+)
MDREEFIDFYNKYYERTLRILYKKLRDLAVAEDKAQEIFTNIYQNAPNNPRGYLSTCIKNTRHQERETLMENTQLELRQHIEKELSIDFRDYWDKIKKMEFLGQETCTLAVFFCYIEQDSKKHEVAKQFALDPKALSARIAEVKKRVVIAIYLLQGEPLEYIFKQVNLPPQKITEIYEQTKRWLKEHGNE